jgi:dihydrofolate reductase
MNRLTAVESITLDGVMQAPGRRDEDTRGGFTHGGWGVRYADEVMGRAMGERMAGDGGLVLGRRTYEDLFGYWPKQKDSPYTDRLNSTRKYVASRTLSDPLPWENSILLEEDAVEAIAALKRDGDRGLGVIGSGELVRSLMRRGLVDEFVLLIHPLVLGSGSRLFPEDFAAALELTDTITTTTGVVIATLRLSDRHAGA